MDIQNTNVPFNSLCCWKVTLFSSTTPASLQVMIHSQSATVHWSTILSANDAWYTNFWRLEEAIDHASCLARTSPFQRLVAFAGIFLGTFIDFIDVLHRCPCMHQKDLTTCASARRADCSSETAKILLQDDCCSS